MRSFLTRRTWRFRASEWLMPATTPRRSRTSSPAGCSPFSEVSKKSRIRTPPAVNGAIDRVVENLPMHLSARMKMNQTLFLEEREAGPMPGIPAGGRQ